MAVITNPVNFHNCEANSPICELVKMGEDSNETMLSLLNHREFEVRGIAAWGFLRAQLDGDYELTQNQRDLLLPKLVEFLSDNQGSVRAIALEAIQILNVEHTPELTANLINLYSTREIGSETILPLLKQTPNPEKISPDFLRLVEKKVPLLELMQFLELAPSTLEHKLAKGTILRENFCDELTRLLESNNIDEILKGLKVVEMKPDTKLLKSLVPLLNHENTVVKARAVEVIRSYGQDRTIIEALIGYIQGNPK